MKANIILKAKPLFSLLPMLLFVITIGCGGGGSGGSSGGESGGTISLAWDRPTTNVDGSALTDLAGYFVYYGTSPGSYTQQIYVGNVTAYTLTNLTKGQTYYIAATAMDGSNPPNESGYSNEVSGVAK